MPARSRLRGGGLAGPGSRGAPRRSSTHLGQGVRAHDHHAGQPAPAGGARAEPRAALRLLHANRRRPVSIRRLQHAAPDGARAPGPSGPGPDLVAARQGLLRRNSGRLFGAGDGGLRGPRHARGRALRRAASGVGARERERNLRALPARVARPTGARGPWRSQHCRRALAGDHGQALRLRRDLWLAPPRSCVESRPTASCPRC